MAALKVLGIFIIIFIGYGANKIGWLPSNASKYLAKIVLNIATPCVVISSMATKELNPENLHSIAIAFSIAIGGYILSWIIGNLFVKAINPLKEDVGVYKNFLMFTNNALIGIPLAAAIFGEEGVFLIVIIGILSPFLIYTIGVFNIKASVASDSSGEKTSIKEALKSIANVPSIASFVGLVIYFLQIPIHGEIMNVLDSIGAVMTPLCMIVIGIQLSESKFREVVSKKLLMMSALRLLIMPALFFLIMLPLHLDKLFLEVATINFMLPCAAICSVLAEEYGANGKLAAEGIFISTFFSILTIPLAVFLLGML